uniref:Uncharacterized protein n=1 Tax=Lepeophtheirus salmonis TaxID=72036 RepID=A0A0K2TBU8_LEPSM
MTEQIYIYISIKASKWFIYLMMISIYLFFKAALIPLTKQQNKDHLCLL